MLQHEGNGCTIDQSVSGFSDILIGFSPHLKLVAFFFSLHASVCHYLWNVLAKFSRKYVKSACHLSLLEVDVIPPKIKCEI